MRVKMNFKTLRLFIIFFCFSICSTFFAEENINNFQEIKQTEENFESNNIEMDFSYFGFPMSFSIGYGFRKNNFSFLIPVGVEMNIEQNFQILGFSGIKLNYKNFYAIPKFKYEFYGSGIKSFSENTEFLGELILGQRNEKGKIELKSSLGEKRWILKDSESDFKRNFTWNETLAFNFFIIDNLVFKATSEAKISLNILPEEKFSSYEFRFYFPFQFNWFYAESTFLYDVFFADYLDIFNNSNKKYRIEKSYSNISNRIVFFSHKNKYYKFVSNFETEQRFYPGRFFNVSNNFFVSMFGNVAFCLTEKNKMDFLYQYGVGLGYNLYSCVPFTFQVGLDNNKNLIMYFGIVSKIIHKM